MPNSNNTAPRTAYNILAFISASHFINDMMQSILLALYPVFQSDLQLSFLQIGLITVAFQFSASLLQPFIGRYTDKHPLPYSLPLGMLSTLIGLLVLAVATSYALILLSAVLIGFGSAVFHPESSRVARMASSGKHGLAQSIFQVGGTMGTAVGPILAAALILPYGQKSVAFVALFALLGAALLSYVSRWYQANLHNSRGKKSLANYDNHLSAKQVKKALGILLILLFSKFIYMTSLNSYFTLYLIDHFAIGIQQAQYCLFIFLFGAALGTLCGGPIGDYIGRKRIILGSILGAAPFTLLLPWVGFIPSLVLVFIIGFIISSAFPAIVVYGQELMPGKTGAISGLFFGVAFGVAGIGAAVLGALADYYSIELVYQLCAFLPLLGVIAFLLPEIRER